MGITEEQLSETCYLIENKILYFSIVALHYGAYLIALLFSIYGVYKFASSSSEIVKKLKIVSSLGIIFWITSDTTMIINFYLSDASHSCIVSSESDNWLSIQHILFIITAQFIEYGYCTLIYSFGLRLEYAFVDTMFEPSQNYKKLIKYGSSLILFNNIAGSLAYLVHLNTISGVLFVFQSLLFVILSIVIVKTIINKMISVMLFVAGEQISKDTSKHISCIDKNKSITAQGKQDAFNSTMMELVVRLTVLYTFAFLSTILLILFVIVDNIISLRATEYRNLMNFIIRLVFICEQICNCICLVYQNKFAQQLYHKNCCICHSMVEKCCLQRANKQLTQAKQLHLSRLDQIQTVSNSIEQEDH